MTVVVQSPRHFFCFFLFAPDLASGVFLHFLQVYATIILRNYRLPEPFRNILYGRSTMKRLFAAVLALWLLLSMTTLAFAAPEEAEEPAEEEMTEEEVPAEEEEKPEEAPEEEIPQQIDPLEGVTAIRRVEITSIVDEKGTATMSMKMQMNIAGVLEELRFAVPENAKNRELVGYRAKNSTENGLRYMTISSDTGFSGEQTFTLNYTLSGLVSQGEESQKLELPLLVAQSYRVGQVALAVNMPKNFTSFPSFSSGYYGEIIEDYMTFSATTQAVTGTVNDILQDSDSLTMTLVLPEGYFAGNHGEGGFSTVMTVAVILLVVLVLLYWWRTLQNNPLRVQLRTLPPDGVNPGDLPFLLSGEKADFNMLVSHWATLGYLSFYVNKGGHVILRRRMSMGNERRAYERKLFELLFGHDDLCDGASLRYKKVGERAQAVLPRYWGRRLYDRNSGSPFLAKVLCCLACGFATMIAVDVIGPEKLHGFFVFLGLIAGFALCWAMEGAFGAFYLSNWVRLAIGVCCGLLLLIVGGIGGSVLTMAPTVAVAAFIGWQTTHGGRRSPYGAEVISQTMGFRRFLLHTNENTLLQMLRRDPQYFYKMLPYAEAMGQGRRFVSLFHDVKLEPCQWYESARTAPLSASAFYDRYLDSLDMLNISIQK